MRQLVMNSSEELSLIVEAVVDIAVDGDSASATIIPFVNYFQQLNLFNHVQLIIIILFLFPNVV